MLQRSSSAPLLLVLVLAACVLAYIRGLGGGFLFDDAQTLVSNPALRAIGTPSQSWMAVALSSDAGALRRPLSMLSFGLNVAAFGMSPLAFKWVNLLIHLGNGLLVYAIGRRLAPRLVRAGSTTQPEWIALLAAGLWLLHPLHVSSVVYAVQRMNELAALFTLAGLLCYVDGRVRMLAGEQALAQAILGLCLFAVLAVFSKENGALIFAYALVIEAVCFRFEAPGESQPRIIKGFFWITIAAPLAIAAAYLATRPHWASAAYAGRDFTLCQRLLTEARVLCDYLVWTFVPNPSWMGIYHDDIATSSGLFEPVSTFFGIVFLLALAFAAWRLRRRFPGFAFAVGWFLVGHSMESTILPLELVFEHRNYLPMAGLLLGTVCAVVPWLQARSSPRSIAVAGSALLFVFGVLTGVRATSWGDPLRLALTDVGNHPDSSRCQYEAARTIVAAGVKEGNRDAAEREAVPYLMRSAALNKNEIHPVTGLILIQARTQTVLESTLADLVERLRQARSYVQVSPFMDMLVSASQEKLSLSPADIERLVEAALSNSRFPAKVRATILNNYGAYQFNIVHDNQKAVSLTVAAAAEDPRNPYFELSLTRIALALGQADMAKQHLQTAQDLDKAGYYGRDIADLQAQLAQQGAR